MTGSLRTTAARALPAIAAVAVLCTAVLAGRAVADPLPPDAAPSGAVVMRPTTGVAGSSFDLTLPSDAACPLVGGGEHWQTFLVPTEADTSHEVRSGLSGS